MSRRVGDRRPVLCLVTDRRRLSPDPVRARERLLALIHDAVDAGIDLVQIRERDLDARPLLALVHDALALARGTATRIVVNDRLDVALAAGADGVHLRGDSIPPSAARAIAPADFVIGRSVHAVDEAAALAGDVDYVIAGTVFATPSKPDAERLLGLDGLTAIVAASAAPVLAIGGITLERAPAIAACRAAGIAAIGLFVTNGGASTGDRDDTRLRTIASRLRASFDSAGSAS